jgi:murein DD-endopeptidase MepM/ murein hydrolase activator NlpD
MPIRDSRVFGAERPGDRPIECANGHCGVDIGGEIWGEPVLAAHDGVVDRVQRGPNEHRGGLYVRLAHRDGTVFTQYFHLAAIPPWLEVGRHVRAGEVIGLVGDTGVKNSGAHLHFTISIRPGPDEPERYIDPEPLIALWPLHMEGKLSAAAEPPGPVRGAVTRRARKRAPERAAPAVVEEVETAAAEPPL